MTPTAKIRVRFWDQMVLVGIGLAVFYTIFDSILSIFLQVDVGLMQRIFGAGPSTIYGRLTILCLFAIFGSHAQYTINQRKMAEAALRESEERFRLIIENSPVGYFELDLQGRFTFFNDATCDILGYPRDELTGRRQEELAAPPGGRKMADIREHVLATGETAKSVDWVFQRKDGGRRFAESSVSLLKDRKGWPSGFGLFLRDITERRRSEALVRAKLAAEAASRTKGQFLASMSHEIRTPLNAIIGLVELLLGSQLRPDQREDLDVVRSSAYALLSIINNVLDFSKIESGKLDLERSAFSLERFLCDSMRIMAMKAHAKGLELAFDVQTGVPDQLVGDPNRLRQVVLNLVDNAVKFTEQGEIVVSVSSRKQTADRVRLQFTVADTGIGVPPEAQARIFEAYDQGDPSVSRRYGGTGLGLAVSAQLVRLMGGRIGIRSRPGRGSAFGFTAVFGRPAEKLRAAAPEVFRAAAPTSVLVVDDNAAARRITADALQRRQVVCQPAGGAAEGRQALLSANPPPEAVLVDSDMPGVDGFDFARWLRQEARFKGRVVMMLTFPHLKRKPECAGIGVDATLVKPFSATELLLALSGDGRQTASAGAEPQDAAPAAEGVRPAFSAADCLRILVAEDTPFNQKFILRLLESWGHAAVLVEDGRRAVAEFEKGGFDAVLMDVQMPEMDGLQAAAAIRRLEASAGGRVPIIAMTAHAVKGDRERCLAAGMDDYVSKPIDAGKLRAILVELAGGGRPAAAVDLQAVGPAPGEALLAAFNNDWDFFAEVVDVFLSDFPRQVELLRRSAGGNDAAGLRRAAHSLKGMLRNFQREDAAGKALALEQSAQSGRLPADTALIDELAFDLQQLAGDLRELLKRKKH